MYAEDISATNGVNVEGSTHRQVVDLIKSGGDCLTLTVISVTPREAERLEPCDDGSAPVGVIGGAANSRATVYQRYDYTDKRSLPVSIPDYRVVMERATGRSYVAFNVHMAGRHLCSRRYREFAALHQQLRKEFLGFNFPKLPGKWPFTLSEQQLDGRRRGLEQYLEKVCAVRVIAESDAVQEFLTDSDDSSNPSPVDLKVLLPDKEVVTVSVLKSTNADDVYRAVCEKIGLSKAQAAAERVPALAVHPELLHRVQQLPGGAQVAVQPRAGAARHAGGPQGARVHILAGGWAGPSGEWPHSHAVLTPTRVQAVEDVNRGVCAAGARLYQLKALQDVSRAADYLALARTLPGYAHHAFPPARTDCRATPLLLLTLGWSGLTLAAWSGEGAEAGPAGAGAGAGAAAVPWEAVREWRADDEAAAARLLLAHAAQPRALTLYTPYVRAGRSASSPHPPHPLASRVAHRVLSRCSTSSSAPAWIE
ncbi:unnamed protein product [Diatraea saccharalis]|uniref:PX domain-containing protein n=1 Tax=Diatraea saccharalis TaxID=40085 RepID=A0A9N9R7D8_9NEOP|nr:unnamed protein product [Diatraea saccharalis]